jgi:hypothetical protein
MWISFRFRGHLCLSYREEVSVATCEVQSRRPNYTLNLRFASGVGVRVPYPEAGSVA